MEEIEIVAIDEVHHAPETVTISKEEYELLKKCEREAEFLKECYKRIKFDLSTAKLAPTVGQKVMSNKFKDRLVYFGFLKKVGKFYLPDKWAVEKGYCYSLGSLREDVYWTLKGRLEIAKILKFEMEQFFSFDDLKI